MAEVPRLSVCRRRLAAVAVCVCSLHPALKANTGIRMRVYLFSAMPGCLHRVPTAERDLGCFKGCVGLWSPSCRHDTVFGCASLPSHRSCKRNETNNISRYKYSIGLRSTRRYVRLVDLFIGRLPTRRLTSLDEGIRDHSYNNVSMSSFMIGILTGCYHSPLLWVKLCSGQLARRGKRHPCPHSVAEHKHNVIVAKSTVTSTVDF